jgi:hypothetical protein
LTTVYICYFTFCFPVTISGGDKTEVVNLPGGSNTYTVNHTLNKFPSVTVSDGTVANPDEEVECKVTYINSSQVRLDFTNNFSGVAIFN